MKQHRGAIATFLLRFTATLTTLVIAWQPADGDAKALELDCQQVDVVTNDLVTLLQTSVRSTQRRLNDGESKELQEAARALEEDTRALHILMAQQAQQAPVQQQSQDLALSQPSALVEDEDMPPISMATDLAQPESQSMREELQEVMRQRDAALDRAEQNAKSLSFVKGELQLALMQARTAAGASALDPLVPEIATATLPPATLPPGDKVPGVVISGPAPMVPDAHQWGVPETASPESAECPPDVITFHCKVSVFAGLTIWVVFFASIACCCSFLAFNVFRAADGTLARNDPSQLNRLPGEQTSTSGGYPRQQGRM